MPTNGTPIVGQWIPTDKPFNQFYPEPIQQDKAPWSGRAPGLDNKPTNPKDAIGVTKLNLDVVPDTLEVYASLAFIEGASKYGSYNWRKAGVRASVYHAAAKRHLKKWWNGEWADQKTKVPHLASVIACIAIILDSGVVGKLEDDRPPKADLDKLITDLEAIAEHVKKLNSDKNPHHYTEKDNDKV